MKKSVQQSDEERFPQGGKKEDIASWLRALEHSLQEALRIDPSKITAAKALRSIIAYAFPLAIGMGTGHVVEGVLIAAGAALLGAVGLTYTYRARTRTLLLTCVGIALSAFIGTITGNNNLLAILLIGIWGVGTGLLVAISQQAMIIGLQTTVALVIFSHFANDPTHAAFEAALVFTGALLQTLLAMIPIPVERTALERSALSSVYQELADFAAHPSSAPIRPANAARLRLLLRSQAERKENEETADRLRDALQQAHTTLSDTNLQAREGQAFYGLLEEAEHIRLTIILLKKLREKVAEKTTATRSLEYLDKVLQTTSDELREIATQLKSAARLAGTQQESHHSFSALCKEAPITDQDVTMQRALTYCDVIHAQLHTVHRLVQALSNRQQPLPEQVNVPQQKHLQFHNAWANLRANLTFHSTAFRHAIRLGVALIIASALARLLPLPLQRGYWIPLTVLLILRPDFTSTFTRGVARFLGTILGVILTGLLISLIAPSQMLLVILAIVTAYLAFSLLYANYALFSVFITMEVIFLLSFVVPQPFALADVRAIATAIGGILALVVYAVWPTWERTQLLDNLAQRLDAMRQYLVAVLMALADPSTYDHPTVDRLRMESRLSRSNAEASLQNSLKEPHRHRVDVDLAQGILGAADTIAQSALALEAYLQDNPVHHPLPMLRPFADEVDEALRRLATAIRLDEPVGELPNLQEALHKMEHDLKAEQHAQPEADIDLHLIISKTKRIVRGIDTINQLLATKSSTHRLKADGLVPSPKTETIRRLTTAH